ncbi:hypothetical protein K7472_08365 [Streptomyces sp. PTM05]|uniref:Uncharacterized protein n=1 Tax=Streptantibioticus parmotrematis TaxID=2873249 RepID=A0ABS7QNY2_9ACTN|nr:hypothetical protein [Streptantibioticus parmotrematis]MBY8884860.1 hypothetical protein [Streptantibioticus parmotrematis]
MSLIRRAALVVAGTAAIVAAIVIPATAANASTPTGISAAVQPDNWASG